jgi:hypothetical protein
MRSYGTTTGDAGAGTPPPPYPTGTSSSQIQRDIRETRAEMDETVDALSERLRPRHLFDDLLEMFRGWGGTSSASASSSASGTMSDAKDKVKDVGSRLMDKLGQNPLPAALIGAGVAWLLFEDGEKQRRTARFGPGPIGAPEPPMHSGSYVDARTGRPYDETYGTGFYEGAQSQGGEQQGGAGGGITDKAKGAARSVKDSVSGAAQGVKEGASSAAEKVSGWMGGVRDSASGAGQAFGSYASSASGHASDRMRRGYDSGKQYLERGIEDYPLAMGAAAMSLGVLAGLLFPRTQVEDEMMGRQSDELKERAADTARQAADATKQVATATVGTAMDEAKSQSGGADSLVEKVKHVAQDVKDAAAESAQREGLDAQSLKEKAQRVGERAKEAAKEETQRQKGKVKGS